MCSSQPPIGARQHRPQLDLAGAPIARRESLHEPPQIRCHIMLLLTLRLAFAAEALLQFEEVRNGRPTWFPVVVAYSAAGEFDSVYCSSIGCDTTTSEQLVEFATEKVEEERRLDELAAKYNDKSTPNAAAEAADKNGKNEL